MIPPPPVLSKEEFCKRCLKLKTEGKPITMRNIDPAFARWVDSNRIPNVMRIGLIVVTFILFMIFVFAVASRVN